MRGSPPPGWGSKRFWNRNFCAPYSGAAFPHLQEQLTIVAKQWTVWKKLPCLGVKRRDALQSFKEAVPGRAVGVGACDKTAVHIDVNFECFRIDVHMDYYHGRLTPKSDTSQIEVKLDLNLEELTERFVSPSRMARGATNSDLSMVEP